MSEYHVPVLFDEAMDALKIKRGGIYLDGTLGGGGHSSGILHAGGKLIALDRDSQAIAESQARFEREGFGGYTLIHRNFFEAESVLDELGITALDGALADLGVSSKQINDPERGFSYRFDGRLDMRMDGESTETAYDVVNFYSEERLVKILFEYGEERFARKIVNEIVKARRDRPIETTLELAEIVKRATPSFYHRQGHPAKKTFQALRIEVNHELDGLGKAIEGIANKLASGGRMAVIAFHSLEDRIVKNVFRQLCTDCICDKSSPICVCGHKATAKSIAKIRPTPEEKERNPRSASATMRVIEKL